MRKTLLTSATLLGLAFGLPALAQPYAPTNDQPPPGETWAHQPGTGMSGPASNNASNIDQSDSRSAIAPHLPQPTQGENASPEAYLRDAQAALAQRRTGLAQQALEMAETRLLDRSTAPEAAQMPDQRPEITQVSQARNALGHGDVQGASAAIQMALNSSPYQGAPPAYTGAPPAYTPTYPAAPPAYPNAAPPPPPYPNAPPGYAPPPPAYPGGQPPPQ
jgi:hypothetical protein